MSKISGTDHSESFDLRVVSGMVIDGSLIVSWATGDHATSQIEWGFDSSVPNKTDVILLKPGERGYRPNQDTPKLVRYHRVPFPQTYVDTEHFFRVISINKAEKREISRVYSVFVTDRAFLQSQVGKARVQVTPVNISAKKAATISGIESIIGDIPDGLSTSDISISPDNTQLLIPNEGFEDQSTTFETNITLTLD